MDTNERYANCIFLLGVMRGHILRLHDFLAKYDPELSKNLYEEVRILDKDIRDLLIKNRTENDNHN